MIFVIFNGMGSLINYDSHNISIYIMNRLCPNYIEWKELDTDIIHTWKSSAYGIWFDNDNLDTKFCFKYHYMVNNTYGYIITDKYCSNYFIPSINNRTSNNNIYIYEENKNHFKKIGELINIKYIFCKKCGKFGIDTKYCKCTKKSHKCLLM